MIVFYLDDDGSGAICLKDMQVFSPNLALAEERQLGDFWRGELVLPALDGGLRKVAKHLSGVPRAGALRTSVTSTAAVPTALTLDIAT